MKIPNIFLFFLVFTAAGCSGQEPPPAFATSDSIVTISGQNDMSYGQVDKAPELSSGQNVPNAAKAFIDFSFSKPVNSQNHLVYVSLLSSEEQVKISLFNKQTLVHESSLWSGLDQDHNPILNIIESKHSLVFDHIKLSTNSKSALKILDWGLMEPAALAKHSQKILVAGSSFDIKAMPLVLVPTDENLRIDVPAMTDSALTGFRILQSNQSRSFEIVDTSKPRSIYVYALRPGKVTQVFGLPNSVKITVFKTPKFPEALPASLDQMLSADPNKFRNSSYEVYSWSVLPEVKIIAFANYQMQSRFFARIAFYTEKNGFRGKILTDKELSGKHDWNAHDYSAQGLANFFNALAQSGVKPNQSEEELKKLVLGFGIISESSGSFVAQKGSLLSFAFGPDTSDQLRRLLLGHEALHGVFFSIPELQKTTEAEYDSMSEAASVFINDYFAYKTYDLQFRELMINEFMAYLFQQSEETLKSELRTLWLPRMKAKFPSKSSQYDRLLGDAITDLVKSRQLMEAPIYERIGLHPPVLSEYRELP